MAEVIFTAANLFVLPFWFLMIVLPHWRGTRRLMRSPWVVAPLPAVYVALVVPQLPQVWPLLVSPRLTDVASLLGRPEAAVVGWVHFLAFDLFVGRWQYLDSRERTLSAWLMAPVLFLTLMLGPAGLLLYLGVREIGGHGGRSEPKPGVALPRG